MKKIKIMHIGFYVKEYILILHYLVMLTVICIVL